jgi:hypothetical protein
MMSSAKVCAAVVDFDDDRAAAVEVRHLSKEASGSERCAAVAVTVSRISPFAVRRFDDHGKRELAFI